MTEVYHLPEATIQVGRLRRLADFLMGINPEARKAAELRAQQTEHRGEEVGAHNFLQALSYRERQLTAVDPATVEHDRSDLGLPPTS